MSSSSSKRIGVLLLALGLLLGQGAARLTAQPNIVGGSSSFFPGQATFNSVCTDTTNKDTGLERESAGVLTVTNCGTTDYATLGSGGLVLRSGDTMGFSSSATDATVAADTAWSRSSAGVMYLGTGAAADRTGTIGAAKFTTTGTGTNSGVTVANGERFGTGFDYMSPSNSTNHIDFQTSNDSATAGGTSFGRLTPSITPPSGSGSFAGLQIAPTINGTSSGKAAGLAIASVTNTLTGGTIKLFDAGTSTTDYFTGFTSKFSVDTSGNMIAAGSLTPSTTGGIVGTTTNDSATAGSVGEYITANVASGSAVSLSTGTTANITSISLTAGDWDVGGVVAFQFGGATSYTNLVGGTSSTSATLAALGSLFDFETPAAVPTASADTVWTVPTQRYSLASTTTVYLVAQGTFTVSTLKAYGLIRARRVR